MNKTDTILFAFSEWLLTMCAIFMAVWGVLLAVQHAWPATVVMVVYATLSLMLREYIRVEKVRVELEEW